MVGGGIGGVAGGVCVYADKGEEEFVSDCAGEVRWEAVGGSRKFGSRESEERSNEEGAEGFGLTPDPLSP